MKFNYTQQDLEQALTNIGISCGDNVFIHSNIGFFGRMENINTSDELCEAYFTILKKILTPSGTLVLPTFTYSFCHNEIYNPALTESKCGILPEYVRKQNDTIRSLDPNFSITAWGRLANSYTEKAAHESFGENSFWERFLKSGGKILCMNFDCGSTFVHYVEKVKSVPYRYNKAFNGIIELGHDKRQYKHYFVHFVFDNPNDYPNFERLDKECRKENICKITNLGRGTMLAIDINKYYNLICHNLDLNPRFLTVGG